MQRRKWQEHLKFVASQYNIIISNYLIIIMHALAKELQQLVCLDVFFLFVFLWCNTIRTVYLCPCIP